ncbi:hypothetical protein Bbelb_361790 [Branchiostoma belcheri]|nr:hypothetical protein Bbelb_361790 [Branchiostoma belcheri]
MLDVMLIKNHDRTITTDVYRKETHTDHYLQWSSNHPVQQKLGIVKTLMHRAETLSQDRTLREVEKGKVTTSEGDTRKTQQRNHKDTQRGDRGQTPSSFAVLPYIKGTTERLKRVFAKHNVSLFSKPGYNLRNALVSPKDPLDPSEKCGVIYKFVCEHCGETYVGETERSLGERSGEHQKSIDHTIEIIDKEARNAHRKIKEAIHIQLVGAKLNRNEGWELPKPYLPLLRKEAEGGRRSTQVSS